MQHYLAFDLGASSGRAMLGTLADGQLDLREVHRFENGGIEVNGRLHWNLLGLFAELKNGLRRALDTGVPLAGLAVDTWGVDFALIDARGAFVGFPYHYRDARTATAMDYAFSRVPRETFYRLTGIQFMPINTVFQLAAMVRDRDPALDSAATLLPMPNAFTYMLCGAVSAEYTIATTSQAFDPVANDWAWPLIDGLGLRRALFPPIAAPCTVAGTLLPAIQAELKCAPIPVILTGSHDTASAVAAVPAEPNTAWAYLSSGTWSLLGVELDKPLITDAALAGNCTNEGGIGGTIRFLKNIMGLWLVQESRREWARAGRDLSFDELNALAVQAPAFRTLVNPDDARFAAPGDMPARLARYVAETGQSALAAADAGAVVRCALESLALRYRECLEEIEAITGRRIEVLHLVGGGSQNALLNQFTANAVNRPVVTGPVEATAIGNIIGQAMATGAIGSVAAARQMVRASFPTKSFVPQDQDAWNAAYARYRGLPRLAG